MDNKEEKLLRIGELAKLSGISVKALHVYEKKNIIKPVYVDENTGYRYYSPDQFRLVESLLELQDMGFSLDEISKILYTFYLLHTNYFFIIIYLPHPP